MQNFLNSNLELLKKKDPALYEAMLNHTPEGICDVVDIESVSILRLYHNSHQASYAYDPRAALETVKKNMSQFSTADNLHKTICIFTGLGLGYHPLFALNLNNQPFRIVILEPCFDIFYQAMRSVDLSPLLTARNVYLFAGEIDWNAFFSTISLGILQTDFFFSDMSALFKWKPELYNNARANAKACSARASSTAQGPIVYGEQWFKNRLANLTLFGDSRPIDVLKDAFKGIPALLISAGPSLNDSMATIKKAIGKCVIIAVDSAVSPLLKNGITPDIVSTLDFRQMNSEKLSPDIIENAHFALASVITSSPLTAKRLPLNQLFFCFQENDTQEWLHRTLSVRHKVPAAGNVSVLSLSIAQIIGADPIIMVGHDYALTSSDNDHVNGTVFSFGWHNLPHKIRIAGVTGGFVETLDFLLGFKQDFEEAMHRFHRRYINATAHGAHIAGTTILSLDSVIEEVMTHEIQSAGIINDHSTAVTHQETTEFIKAINTEINSAKKNLLLVQKLIKLNKKILSDIDNKRSILKNTGQFSQLPSNIRQSRQKLHKLYSGFKPFMAIEEIAASLYADALKIQTFQKTDNYMEKFRKEVSVFELKMNAHHHGLTMFINEAGKLRSSLQKELNLQNMLERSSSEKAFLELGELYLTNRDALKAKRCLDSCLDDYPEAIEAKVLLGEANAQLLDFNGAMECWGAAEKVEPRLKPVIGEKKVELARYWWERGKEEPFNDELYLHRAMKTSSCKALYQRYGNDFWKRCKTIINQHLRNKCFDKAASFLNSIASIRDTSPEWYFLNATLQYNLEDLPMAQSMIREAIETQPDNAQWLAFHARILLESDQFTSGLEQLEKAVELDSTQAVLWEELGDSLFNMSDYASAAIAYEKCFLALPSKVDTLRKFGDCYFERQQFEAAKTAYLEVLKRDETNEPARKNLNKINP